MQSKLIWIFSGASFLLLGALVVKVDRDYVLDKKTSLDFYSRSQLSTLSQAVSTELNAVAKMTALSIQQLKANNSAEYGSDLPYSRFQMLGSLLPPPSNDSDWSFEKTFFLINSETSETKSWAPAQIVLLLRTVKEHQIPSDSNFVVTLQNPQMKKTYIAVISHFANQWFVGLLGPELFLSLIDRQKGEMKSKSLFFINRFGQVLAHSTSEYVGTLMKGDPFVDQIISENSVNGGGLIERKTGNIFEYFDRAADSNIYSIVSISQLEVFNDRKSNIISLLALGFAIMSVTGLAVALVYKKEEPSIETKAPPISLGVENNDQIKIFQKVASSLSHEINGPINDILRAIHLVKSSLKSSPESIPKSEPLRENLVKIEEQARNARDITRKLLIFAEEESGRTIQTPLETPINKALKMVEGKFFAKGVILKKQITPTPPFEMDPTIMSRAIEALLVNAIEAMDRTSKKELLIDLSPDKETNNITLTLTDSGEGMTTEEIKRAFDPFFTTRASTNHVGLGLSMALGVVREFGGNIAITSEKGKGTTVKVSFLSNKPLIAPVLPALPAKLTALEPEDSPASNSSHKTPVRIAPPAEKILTDDSFEKLIDGFSETDCENGEKINLPSEQIEASFSKTVELERKGFSSKIDKPNFSFNRKTSQLEDLVVQIRKPGIKPEDKA